MGEFFNSEQLEFFRSAVQKVAGNRNELWIPTARLGEVLRDIGHPVDPWDLQLYTANLDPDHCGAVSFGDFLAVIRRQMNCDHNSELEDSLRTCDPLHFGWITVTDLKRVLSSLSSETFAEAEIEEIAKEAVSDGEKVDYEELIRGLRGNDG